MICSWSSPNLRRSQRARDRLVADAFLGPAENSEKVIRGRIVSESKECQGNSGRLRGRALVI